MSSQTLHNQSRGVQLATRVEAADSLWSRLIGLLGRSSLPPEATLWLSPCNSVHTWFMKFPIDVVFVDRELVVKRVVTNLGPWRMAGPVWGAKSAFEFAAGAISASNVREGDQLHVGP